MNRTLRLVLLREIPEDAILRQKWNDLVRGVEQPQAFFTYEWSLAVQRAYHESLHPLLFLAYDQQESLYGVAALAADATRDSVSFLCATTADYCDFISSSDYKAAFVSAVLSELRKRGVREITLTNLPADSTTFAALEEVSTRYGYRPFARTAYRCAQVLLSQVKRDPRDNKLVLPRRKMVRRFISAMGRETPVRLDHARTWSEVKPILPLFVQAHVARFLVTGRISNLARTERRLFLEELARLLSESGWLALTRIMTDSNIYAWNYGFQFQGTWFWYQPTFDSDSEKYSPGFCLLAKLVEEAAETPAIKLVDLGLGAEEYKDAFENQTRETLYVRLSSTLREHIGEILRYRLVTAVFASPVTEKLVRSVFARYKALRQRVHSLGVRGSWKWATHRMRSAVASRDEVFFYELTDPAPELLKSNGVSLKSIDLNTLATAAMQNAGDEGTLAYLLRCAHRLRTETKSIGFVLTNPAGELLHFTWATPFEGFYWSELNSRLPTPAPGSVLLFDSWTPASQRGRGHYGPTLGLAVARIRQEGKRFFVFSASTNTSSVRGLEKAGFRRSFSVLRYRLLWWQKLIHKNVAPSGS